MRRPAFPVRAALWRATLLALVWWALVDGRPGSWAVGGAGIALAVALSLRLLPPLGARFFSRGMLGFLAFFLVQSLRGGTQVAWFALRRRPALRPAILDFSLRLPEGIGQVLLANTLSLLPGTLSVELRDGRLSVHVLDRDAPIESQVRNAETHVARMLDLALEPA